MQTLMQSEIVWRLVLAAVLGIAFGLERSLAGKHAGMRTYGLVSLGSCLFVIVGALSAYELSVFPGLNPVGIASSVVVGIGFIGAGLAALRGEHPELTTASGIWVAAGIGMAVGFGLYTVAIAATAIGLAIFWLFAKLERRLLAYENHNEG
jgi:putative Mg2+ transporter-C (MgtC) family protein